MFELTGAHACVFGLPGVLAHWNTQLSQDHSESLNKQEVRIKCVQINEIRLYNEHSLISLTATTNALNPVTVKRAHVKHQSTAARPNWAHGSARPAPVQPC